MMKVTSVCNSFINVSLSLLILSLCIWHTDGQAISSVVQKKNPTSAKTIPESQGFSKEGLKRIDNFFQREITAKRLPGAVVGIMRDGHLVYLNAFGTQNPSTGQAMRTDSIFAIASMTKPMVAVGALTLTQEGKLPLFSTVDQYIPAVATMKVELIGQDGKIQLVPQNQPIRIQDLMRHTSGFAYGGRPDTAGAAASRYPATGDLPVMSGASEFVQRVSQLPLVFQPGTTFEYSTSYEMLGAVMEQVSGQRLGAYLQQTIWDPLGMKDTTFQVSDSQKDRLAHGFKNDPLTSKPQTIHPVEKNPTFDCGGGCAFSTVPDYLRFGQMLLDGGRFENRQILGPNFVKLMLSNHLGPSIINRVSQVEPHRAGYGYGLGVAVRTVPGFAAVPGNEGEFSWNGTYGTGFFADPKARLVVVFATAAPGDLRKYYREQVQDLVYGAMTR